MGGQFPSPVAAQGHENEALVPFQPFLAQFGFSMMVDKTNQFIHEPGKL